MVSWTGSLAVVSFLFKVRADLLNLLGSRAKGDKGASEVKEGEKERKGLHTCFLAVKPFESIASLWNPFHFSNASFAYP
jgi:hypothetical protein